LTISKVNFEGKGGKITKTKKKKLKGFEKKFLLTISRVNFEGKGRKHIQNDTKTKKNEKGSRKSSF